MLRKSQVRCWIVTDGTVGMENQALGLAAALGVTPEVKRVKLRAPWRQLSPFFRLCPDMAYSSKGDAVDRPWPDLIIASGRASVPLCLSVRQDCLKGVGQKCFTVYIHNPVIDPSRFDLVVTPRHDGLLGPNVMTTRGSLHRVTPELLAREAAAFAPAYADLPDPKIAVVIGGSNSVYQLTPREMKPLAEKLANLARQTGGGLMITASRRTGQANVEILERELAGVPHDIWDGTPPNPYYGMLGLAKAILVTVDSVNMNAEACSTGKPVYSIDLPGGSEKFRRFHQVLRDEGLSRPFEGVIEDWSYRPLNDVELVAARVRAMVGIVD